MSAKDSTAHPSAWRRLAARLIDWAIHFFVVLVVMVVLWTTDLTDDMSSDARWLTFFGVTALLRGIFEIGFIGTKGGTPGKLALGMRVRSTTRFDGYLMWGQATVRGFLIDIPTLFGGVYYIVLILLPNKDDTFVALWSILWGAVWVFWLVQVLSIFSNPARRGLHDKLAGTIVVDE